MNHYEVHNRAYNALPAIEEAEDISDKDAACLRDVEAVLRRYVVLDRFGLCLLHKHFDLDPDEVLVEFIDYADRSVITRPVKMSSVQEGRLAEAIWRLDGTDALSVLYRAIPDGEEPVCLSQNDMACFRELKSVLEKHGFVHRFGPFLLDKRYYGEFKVDEGVYEITSHSERISLLRVGDLRKIEALKQEVLDGGKRTLVTFAPALLEEVSPELAVFFAK